MTKKQQKIINDAIIALTRGNLTKLFISKEAGPQEVYVTMTSVITEINEMVAKLEKTLKK